MLILWQTSHDVKYCVTSSFMPYQYKFARAIIDNDFSIPGPSKENGFQYSQSKGFWNNNSIFHNDYTKIASASINEIGDIFRLFIDDPSQE